MPNKRTDKNQTEIVKALRQAGCSVFILSDVGKGMADLIVGHRGKNYLVEVKNPERNWKHTPDQEKFIRQWRGQRITITTITEIIKYLGLTA